MVQLLWAQPFAISAHVPRSRAGHCMRPQAFRSLCLCTGPTNLGSPLALPEKAKIAGCIGKCSGKDLLDHTVPVLWGLLAFCLNDFLIFKS